MKASHLIAETEPMKLKVNLKLHLAAKKLNASDLSRRSKVPKATISDWLAGSSPKNLNQLKVVAGILETTIDELVFGDYGKIDERYLVKENDLVPMGNFEVFMKRLK